MKGLLYTQKSTISRSLPANQSTRKQILHYDKKERRYERLSRGSETHNLQNLHLKATQIITEELSVKLSTTDIIKLINQT